MTKPQLVSDADLDTVQYPCMVQPKIDGVRGVHLNGRFTGRSLDPFKGFGVTDYFSDPKFAGLDGELTLGQDPTQENLCSNTTGAVNKFVGVSEMADLHWHCFDLVTEDTVKLRYVERYAHLAQKLRELNHRRLNLVSFKLCTNRQELDAEIEANFAAGYEGTIIRNPNALYKEGRPSKKTQEVLRVKAFSDFEILVTGFTEGNENHNEKTKNALGNSERSSHQENLVPNGQVGSLQGTLLKDFYDLQGVLLFKAGLAITASSGKMTIADATYYYNNPKELVGHIAKIKTMTTGVKDLPRFPTFVSLRSEQDL
jgi:DNA ligase-1